MIYDEHAPSYASARRADPRIAAAIDAALGDAETLVNLGPGAPPNGPAAPDEHPGQPNPAKIPHPPPAAAPAVQASAEALPFAEDTFDAAMAVLTVHHWPDREAGLAEMRRVARRRIVIVAFDPGPLRDFWMVRDYFPAIAGLHAERNSSLALAAELPAASVQPIPVPRDCSDLFFAALWARPELVLDPDVVRPMWVWQSLSEEQRRTGSERLAADLASGAWDERNGHLRKLEELDAGLRLISSLL